MKNSIYRLCDLPLKGGDAYNLFILCLFLQPFIFMLEAYPYSCHDVETLCRHAVVQVVMLCENVIGLYQ